MSFVDTEDVFEVVEGLMKKLLKEVKGYDLKTPIPRLTFNEAMEKYGSDKPDLRFGLEMVTLNETVRESEFRVFKDAVEGDGIVTGLLAKGCGDYTRNQLDVLTDFVKKLGAGGLIWMRVKEEGLEAPVAKFFSDEEKQNIINAMNAEAGDLIFILAGKKFKTLSQMGAPIYFTGTGRC
jgi:aspartyl-tRNA synthetase